MLRATSGGQPLSTGSSPTFAALTLNAGALNRTSQTIIIPAGSLGKVGTTAGWTVAAADNVNLATLPAGQTASTLVVPIPGLKSGWTITAFYLIGQIESAGGTVTLDANLRSQTAAAADVTDASVASMTQLSVTADTAVTTANTNKGSLTQAVGAAQSFYMLITGTTAASTDIALQAIAITVTEA